MYGLWRYSQRDTAKGDESMIRKTNKKVTALALIMILVMSIVLSACGDDKTNYEKISKRWDAACHEIGGIKADESLTNASYFKAGDPISDWMVIVEKRAGLDKNFDEEGYLKNLKKYISKAYESDEKLDQYKSTEWHRMILVLLAFGKDPRNFAKKADGTQIDLVNDGIFNWCQEEKIDYQGSNALIYSLLCIKAGDYKAPEGARYSENDIIKELIAYQMEDGGFGLNKGGSDLDITSMAIQALAPYIDKKDVYTNAAGKSVDVKTAIDSALTYLSEKQSDGGYFSFQNHYSSDSGSQVILALCSLGIDPTKDERFIKNGGDPVSALLSFETEDGGIDTALDSSGTGKQTNVLATRQAISALTALRLLQKGNGKFFDFNNNL